MKDLNEQVAKTESLLSRVYGRTQNNTRETQSACGYSYNPSIMERKNENPMASTQHSKSPIVDPNQIRDSLSMDK